MIGDRLRYRDAKEDGGKIRVAGHDYGGRLYLHEDHGDYQIWKWKGGMDWADVRAREYTPTAYHLVRVLEWNAVWTWVKIIEERTPKYQWRALLAYWRAKIENDRKSAADEEAQL